MEMVLSNDVMLASTLSVQFYMATFKLYIFALPQVCGDTGCGKSTQAKTVGQRVNMTCSLRRCKGSQTPPARCHSSSMSPALGTCSWKIDMAMDR